MEAESAVYRRARDELLVAEKELRDQRERVAGLRRQLPLESMAEDYVLQSTNGPVALTQLFNLPDRPLILTNTC